MEYYFCKLRAIFFAFENTAFDVARISEFDIQKLFEKLNNQIKRSFATVGQDNRSWTHQIETAKNLRQVDSMVFFRPMERRLRYRFRDKMLRMFKAIIQQIRFRPDELDSLIYKPGQIMRRRSVPFGNPAKKGAKFNLRIVQDPLCR